MEAGFCQIQSHLSKINMPYTISKLFNTLGVNSSYVITLHSVFVQANGELNALFIYYELLISSLPNEDAATVTLCCKT